MSEQERSVKIVNEASVAMDAADMPETLVINGVTYRREADELDELANTIEGYQAIAKRTGLSLRQVAWFGGYMRAGLSPSAIATVMPD